MAGDEINVPVSVDFALFLQGVAEDRDLTLEELLEQALDAWLEKNPSPHVDDGWRARLGTLLDARKRAAGTRAINDEEAERIVQEEIAADRRENDERRTRRR